jgi:hypothetical protein
MSCYEFSLANWPQPIDRLARSAIDESSVAVYSDRYLVREHKFGTQYEMLKCYHEHRDGYVE